MEQTGISGKTAAAIAGSLEAAVESGRMRPGDPVPTVRELAMTLKVSPTTVAAAYKLLQARGLVSGLGRRGTRITSETATAPAGVLTDVPVGTTDLATGNPDPELLPPFDHVLRSMDATASRMYDGPVLLPALATFVAGELEADGIPSRALTVAAGGLDGIERVLREHLRPGDRVAVEDPCFPGVLSLLAFNGFIPVSMPVDAEGPLPGALDAALRSRPRALVITPRAQNPTGAAMTASRAAELRRALGDFPDLLIVENDPLGPIAGAAPATLCDASRGRWAVVRSVSKFLGPDLRAAFVAGDATTIARVERRQAVGPRWVSHILQRCVLALWSDPSSGRRLARAADAYRQRREALLAECAARGLAAWGASGLNVWVPVPDEARTVQALVRRGWAVMPGERFRLRTPPAIRVTTAALKPQHAACFAADLADVLRPPRGGSFA